MELTTDPLGRKVQLTEERWNHIVEGHPYMAPFRADVMRAIEEPTHRIEQPRPDQDWFYLQGAGPSRWLKVVVAFDEDSIIGSVRTAFPRRSKP
jgi:hypothetical protein